MSNELVDVRPVRPKESPEVIQLILQDAGIRCEVRPRESDVDGCPTTAVLVGVADQVRARNALRVRDERTCQLYPDYKFLCVHDGTWEPGAPADFTNDEIADRLTKPFDQLLNFVTGSYATVTVTVQSYPSEPELEPMDWDHVVEGGLSISQYIFVSDLLFGSGLFFRVEPGHYRVRCCMANLAASIDVEVDEQAGDRYVLQFWPAEGSERRVLKRWSEAT